MEEIKRAIIVAAGEGSRLRPVTLTTPKPLVPVNGVRMIDTQINALKKNGIHDIYIVTGYKKEQFYETYKDDPDITVMENPYYLQGNNITSLYQAREFLPGAAVLEGDLRITDPDILTAEIEKSCYCASHMNIATEWALTVEDGTIVDCITAGGLEDSYRLWGISMWTYEDGLRLSELIRQQVEDIKDWSIYWDELALFNYKDQFDLGIREISLDSVMEIDSFDELVAIDPSYKEYKMEDK